MMSKPPYHGPKPEAHNKAENHSSASVSSREEMTDQTKSEIKETFTPGKNYDAEMVAKFGKEPTEKDVVNHFAAQEKFKGKNFLDILTQLEKDENKPMADRLRTKIKGYSADNMTPDQKDIVKEESPRYKDVVTGPLDEKAKKKIEANKTAELQGFTILDQSKLQVGDIIINQTGVTKAGSPIFRYNATKKKYESINYATNIAGSSVKIDSDISEERMQDLKKFFKWHEVTDKDLKLEEKKPEATKVEPKKEEPKKEEKPEPKKEEKKIEVDIKTTDDKGKVEKYHADSEKKSEHKTKGKRKVDINPLNRARHISTRVVSGVGGFLDRVGAKVNATLARPQDIFYKKYWTDIGKNIAKTPEAMLKTVTGAVYKPHRDNVKFEDVYKGYGPTRGPNAKKYKIKKVPRFIGKFLAPFGGTLPKFGVNISRGLNHAVHETLEAVKESKRHRNPKKRNFKTFKYSKAKEAFKRAFSWNKEPEIMADKESSDEMKKAA